MKKIYNILVFPGGTENGLEIQKSLSYSKEIKLFSASNSSPNHAEFVYENSFILPDVSDSKCLKNLNELCAQLSIDFIFPANSLVIDFLINNRQLIECPILQPNSEIVKLIRSKRKTYEIFEKYNITPEVFDEKKGDYVFPIFAKPDSLYGSKGARIINSVSDLPSNLNNEDIILTEYLPGDEHTIECFSNSNELLYVFSRTRERIRMGTSMRSFQSSEAIQSVAKQYAEIIFKELKIDGLWFIQIKKSVDGIYKILEVESRVPGTMCLSRNRGANLPLAEIYYRSNKNFNFNFNHSVSLLLDRSLSNKFKSNIEYEKVFVDLDDTIIVHGKINILLISFLYQCVNDSIPIFLITKSIEKNLVKYLQKFKIINLFDEIIHIKESDYKSNYINGKAIFIDDSFSQRVEVSTKCKIPTFDSSMIESLINYKK